MGWPWLLVTVVGPILLAVAIIYAMTRNRQQKRPGDEERSDRAAKVLREQLNREDERRENHETRL